MVYTSRRLSCFPAKKTDSVINVKVEFGEGEGKVPLDNMLKEQKCISKRACYL